MGKLIISASSGGSADSDVLTSLCNNVLEGTTAITHDSDGEPIEGTMPNRHSGAKGLDCGTNHLGFYARFPYGFYHEDGSNPWVHYTLAEVANAIGAISSKIMAGQSIAGVPGTATNDAILDPNYLLEGYSGYDDGVKKNGAMPNRGSLAKTLAINETFWLPKGYYSGGNVQQSIPTQGWNYLIPKPYNQVVCSSGRYVTGEQGLYGDPNLIGANIVKGKMIFGVSGTADGYINNPLSLFDRNGWTGNVQTRGFSKAFGTGNKITESTNIQSLWYISIAAYLCARTNQSFNLSQYNYIKISCLGNQSSGSNISCKLGVSTNPNLSSSNYTSYIDFLCESGTSKTVILNVTGLSGDYFIYMDASNAQTGVQMWSIELSTT